ncbi:MAG: M14 family metallopeptidase [Crocinitomicaceae bacterium]|nr:M14 family metallopeptidase [Crocinitomicaceae bacterium]
MKKSLFLLIYLLTSVYLSSQDSLYVIEDDEKYRYSMIMEDLDYLAAKYSDYVFPFAIGDSEFGFPLKAVRIGTKEKKPYSIFMVGNVHAREDYSSKLVMKFLNHYLLSIEGNSNVYPSAKKYLDSLDIYIMPVANPDGLKIAHQDWEGIEKWRYDVCKMIRKEGFEEWKANGKGIDLNDSFDDGNHHLKHGDQGEIEPASEDFKGYYPAEPIETKYLQEFVNKLKPLMTISYHTKGDLVYWADAGTHAIFEGIDTEINQKVLQVSGFDLVSVSKNPVTYGCGLENYVRAKMGLLGSCVELSKSNDSRVQYADSLFNDLVWKNASQIPMVYIKEVFDRKEKIMTLSNAYCLELKMKL